MSNLKRNLIKIKINKKGLEWHYIVLLIVGALVLLWFIIYSTGLGSQMTNTIKELFDLF